MVAASGLIGTFRGPRDTGTGYVKLFHSMGMATGHRGRWTYVKGAMGNGIHSACQPRDHSDPCLGKLRRDSFGGLPAIGSCPTRADDGHRHVIGRR